jgi:hypothetical protein
MTMKEKLRQMRSAICVNRREITHTCRVAVDGARTPRNQGRRAVYVTRCATVEVIPRSHKKTVLKRYQL